MSHFKEEIQNGMNKIAKIEPGFLHMPHIVYTILIPPLEIHHRGHPGNVTFRVSATWCLLECGRWWIPFPVE